MTSAGERARKILVDDLCGEPETVLPTDQLSELTDDLGLVELVLALEDEFEIAISDDDFERLVTVQDMIDYIERRWAEKT